MARGATVSINVLFRQLKLGSAGSAKADPGSASGRNYLVPRLKQPKAGRNTCARATVAACGART
ncbi:MAG TPA: hypothetical protein VEV61_06070 [Streptosporangiaceae bacterium]|nr:hypothetical protein [Streptosporangiaceae bacterium]